MSWYGNLEEAVSKHDGRSQIVKNIKTLTLLFTEAWYTKRQGKVLEGARPWYHRIGRRGQFVCRDNACGRSALCESLPGHDASLPTFLAGACAVKSNYQLVASAACQNCGASAARMQQKKLQCALRAFRELDRHT
eukprot:s6608_g3.t1